MDTRLNSNLKANLFDLKNGYYISKNDPLFWKKLFQRQSENEEALFHVGLDFEREARNYLEKFYITRADKYLNLYRKTIAQALDFVRGSFNKGFIPARRELLRIEQEMKIVEEKISRISEKPTFSKRQIILLFIAAIIISLLGGSFLHYKVLALTNYSNHNYAYMLPYEVIDSRPNHAPTDLNTQSIVIIPEKEKSKERIVNALVQRLKLDYEKDPQTAKYVLALDENKQELGIAVWEGGKKSIQVFIYPSNSLVTMNNKEQQLWETTTVIRSALYQFVKKNGYVPKDLKALCQAYPNNYLNALPKEPFTMKSTVTTSPTRDGGWLFSLEELPGQKDLVSIVKDALKPNLPYYKDIPFQPLTISINKKCNTLSLISENRIIRNYEAALGKDNSTPEGMLYISKKITNPDKDVPKSENVYGTRAMELSNMNYAIHGTNLPSGIGKNISHGCIRLKNSDIEELYALVPLNTTVEISNQPSSSMSNDINLYSPNMTLYDYSDDPMEEDPLTKYHWAN